MTRWIPVLAVVQGCFLVDLDFGERDDDSVDSTDEPVAVEPRCDTPIDAVWIGDRGTHDLASVASVEVDGIGSVMVGDLADVNADGCTDLMVADPIYLEHAYVHFGPGIRGRSIDEGEVEVFESATNPHWWFGSQVRAGDVNGDGIDDLWVGSQFLDGDAGMEGIAYLLHGPLRPGSIDLATDADASRSGSDYADLIGYGIAVGDMNGDELADTMLMTRNNGKVHVAYGPVKGHRHAGDGGNTIVSPPEESSYDAWIVGDVNGDGLDDIAVQAEDDAQVSVYVFYSPVVGTRELHSADAVIRADDPQTRPCGYAANVGDLDGDGIGELLCGHDLYGSNPNAPAAARLFMGPVAGEYLASQADAILEAPAGFGAVTVVGGGDFDGDGTPDFAVAPQLIGPERPGVAEHVAIYLGVPSGTSSTRRADLVLDTFDEQMGLGEHMAFGDLTGDGVDDLLVQGGYAPGDYLTTAAWIVAGQPGI